MNSVLKQEIEALSKATGVPPQILLAMAMQNQDVAGEMISVKREGKQVILPPGMSYNDAIVWLKRRRDEEEQEVEFVEDIDAFPYDAAYAFTKAMAEEFGWTELQPTPGFWGPRPPKMITIHTGVNETVQIPWGRFKIPNVDGNINTMMHLKDGNKLVLRLHGVVKKKHVPVIAALAETTRRIVGEQSIYKGKAIRLVVPNYDEEHGEAYPEPDKDAPRFLDLNNVKKDELVFNKSTQQAVEINVFNPILHTDECRKHKIPLKRGILFAGPYGTGKTLTANVVAKLATENGWTYIYLENSDDLADGIQFAKRYQPAVIFSEDIDNALKGDRNKTMNDILNTIDGVDSKGTEVMVILTTNFVEKIDKAMLRPGRLDAIISTSYPDSEAAQRLIRLYARDLLAADEDLTQVGVLLEGQTPAVLREVVERSKLSAITRGGNLSINAQDLLATGENFQEHLELLKPEKPDTRSDIEKAAVLLADGLKPLPSFEVAEQLSRHSR